MLGIGLGGFAAGFDKGVGIGEKLDKASNRRALSDAAAQGKTDYDAAVTAGTAKPDDADAMLRFTMPKIIAPLVAANDLEGARAAGEWLRSDETRRATASFGKGMLAAQAGDMPGALGHFVEAARTRGYGPDINIDNPQTLPNGGVSVNVTTKDGRKFTKAFNNPGELLQFGAANLNPEKAFETWQADQRAEKTAAREVGTDQQKYQNRKNIDLAAAPQENASFVDRFRATTDITTGAEGQRYGKRKDVDLDFEKRQQAAGLGPAAYEAQNVTQVGPDGKPVVTPYTFDRRRGTASRMRDQEGNEVSGALSKPGSHSGEGGRRQFKFEVLRDAYKNLGYSEKDALDLANGQKPPKDTDLITIARQMTQMEMPASDLRTKPEDRQKRMGEILTDLRQRYATSKSPSGLPKEETVTGIEVRDAPAKPATGARGTAGTREAPHKPATQADFDALPKGSIFINPADGKPYRKN